MAMCWVNIVRFVWDLSRQVSLFATEGRIAVTITIRIHCSYMVINYNGEIYLCFSVSLHHDERIHSPPWNIWLNVIQVESAPYVYILIRNVFSNISAQPFLFYCYCLH